MQSFSAGQFATQNPSRLPDVILLTIKSAEAAHGGRKTVDFKAQMSHWRSRKRLDLPASAVIDVTQCSKTSAVFKSCQRAAPKSLSAAAFLIRVWKNFSR
jgi:hypothetical protein